MATLSASAPSVSSVRAGSRRGLAHRVLLPVSTAVTLLGVALLITLTPWSTHLLLEAAGADGFATPAQREALSDLAIHDLVFWGDFSLPGVASPERPFFTADEVGHLEDARLLLYALLGLAAICAVIAGVSVRRSGDSDVAWRAVGRGGAGLAVAVLLLGIVGLFAFGPAFELFHRVFFPGGNYAFNPATSNLVRLYPQSFWVAATAMLGGSALGLGLLVWSLTRGAATNRMTDR